MSQIRVLGKKIAKKKEELDAYCATMTLPGQPLQERVQTSPKIDKIGDIIGNVQGIEYEIDSLMLELHNLKKKAFEWSKLLGTEQRTVLLKYYVDCFSMADVADILGVSLKTAYNLRKKVLNILDNNSII